MRRTASRSSAMMRACSSAPDSDDWLVASEEQRSAPINRGL